MRRAFLQIGLVLAGVAGFVGLLLWLHPTLLDDLRGTKRYRVPLAEIDCAPPAGMERIPFLEDVQYYANLYGVVLPDQLDPLDEGLPDTLRDAFRHHPWVERVDQVTVAPRSIYVGLVFRRPVLAVKHGGDYRAVDGAGVLLPKNASTKGLPRLDDEVARPQGPEGTGWGDPRVVEAARRAAAP